MHALRCLLPATLAVGILFPAVGAAQEQATLEAFAAWHAEGEAVQTGPEEATLVATLAGTLYVETGKGPVPTGLLRCPVVLRVNLANGAQEGKGHCGIALEGGDQVFATLTCSGVHLVGCSGEAVLTGGTGHFAGVTGGGNFTLRSGLERTLVLGGDTVAATAEGIIFWPALSYSIPAQ